MTEVITCTHCSNEAIFVRIDPVRDANGRMSREYRCIDHRMWPEDKRVEFVLGNECPIGMVGESGFCSVRSCSGCAVMKHVSYGPTSEMGQFLRTWRNEVDMSLAEMAAGLGLDVAQMSCAEHKAGIRMWTPTRLRLLAEFINLTAIQRNQK